MDVVYRPKDDVIYITISRNIVARREHMEGHLIVKYDEQDDVAGIEVHQASQRSGDPRHIQCALGL